MILIQDTISYNPWQKFSDWGHHFVEQLPITITAILFVVLIFFLSGWVKKIVARILKRKSGNQAVAGVMASFISILFIITGIFIALAILGLNQTVTSLLAGAGILGLILGLALQDTLSSAIAGVVMTMRKSYKVGDFVETNNFLGTIVEINLRNTTIRQTNGVDAKIPNKLVLNSPLINYSLRGERRVDIKVNISYDTDLNTVENIIRTAFKNHVQFNTDKEFEIFFTEFAPFSISVLVRFWIKKIKQADFLQAQSEAIKAIKLTFDQNGISMPYPVQVVELKNSHG